MAIILPAPLNQFAVLAGSTVTNSGPTVVTGNVGVSPGSAITGFPPGTATGVILGPGPVTVSAQSENTAAYLAAQALAPGTAIVADLGGQVLTPGTYTASSSAANSGVLTLNGPSGTQFVFQIGTTLTFAVGASVVLTGGVRPQDVIWQVGSSATINAGATFIGLLLALTSISVGTGASVAGVLYAQNGAVTLLTNAVTNPLSAGSTGIVVTNEWPVLGLNTPTNPPPLVMFGHQEMTVLVTGDGGHTAFTVTHNWGESAADTLNSFPEEIPEVILASVPVPGLVVTSKTPNTVVFSCNAFVGAALRVRLKRPWTPKR